MCPVSIILPTIAMQAGRDKDQFLAMLPHVIEEAKDMLLERYKYICSQSAESAKFMYENGLVLGYHPAEGIESALKHGTLALGQLGLAETLQLLIGKDQTDPEGLELAKQIEQIFRSMCDAYKHQWHYKSVKPTDSDIKNKMVKIAEHKLNRELTTEEKDKILNYSPAKKFC